MSSHNDSTLDEYAATNNDQAQEDVPTLTLVPRSNGPRVNSSGRRYRGNSSQIMEVGYDSDGSMPSLQTVSDSSDDELYDQSGSDRETESEEDSEEEEEEEEEEEYPDAEQEWYEPIPPPEQPPAYEGFIEEIRRRRNTGRTTPPTPPLGTIVPTATYVPLNTEERLNAFQRQLRTMVESFTAVASTANGTLLPEDFGVLQDIGNLNLAQLLNPFTEVDGDPDRAKVIMAKLEIVPNELVSRYEKLRSGTREGVEDVDGCAICRESFLEDEEIVAESVVVGHVTTETVYSSDALSGKQTSEYTTPSDQASTSSQPVSASVAEEGSQNATRILAFPCPGMHLFHADCLAPWLARKTTCPSCRYDIDPHSLTLSMSRFAPGSSEASPFEPLAENSQTLPPQVPVADRPPSPRAPGFFEEASAMASLSQAESTERRDVEVDATQASSTGDAVRPSRRRQWKPPKGRDFRRWLDREERRKGGLEVEDDQDAVAADSSASDEDDLSLTEAQALAQLQVPLIIRELVGLRTALSPAQPPTMSPPVPAAIPAIPPWEEGEFPGSHASAFVGARRAAAVGGFPRPSPLRFQTTAPDVESDSDSSRSEDDDGADDVASLPELGATDDDSDEDGAEATELPPLIPDTTGHEYAATPSAALPGPTGGQSTNTTHSLPVAQQRFADRLPRLFQGYFQPRASNLGLHTSPNTSQPIQESETSIIGSLGGGPHSSLDDVDD